MAANRVTRINVPSRRSGTRGDTTCLASSPWAQASSLTQPARPGEVVPSGSEENESRWPVSIFRLSVMSSHDHVRRSPASVAVCSDVPGMCNAGFPQQSVAAVSQCCPVAVVAATYLHGRHPYGSHRQQLNNMFPACHGRRPYGSHRQQLNNRRRRREDGGGDPRRRRTR